MSCEAYQVINEVVVAAIKTYKKTLDEIAADHEFGLECERQHELALVIALGAAFGKSHSLDWPKLVLECKPPWALKAQPEAEERSGPSP